MKRKWMILALLCVAVVILGLQYRGHFTNNEPGSSDDQPKSPASDHAKETAYYWRETGRLFRSSGRAVPLIREHGAVFRAGKLETAKELQAFWERWSALYKEDVQHTQRAIEGIELLPILNVDPIAVDIATEGIEYLRARIKLNQRNSFDCALYSALWADIDTAGGVADVATPEGKRFLQREEELIAKMARIVETEGKEERDKLASFLTKARKSRIELTKKYQIDIPDINSPSIQGDVK